MNELLYSTSYLWGILLLIPLYIYACIRLKENRKEIILSGITFGIGAILIGKFYANFDYWNPPYIFGADLPIEDFLYGFIFGGLSTVIYQLVFPIKFSLKKRRPHFESILLFAIFSVFCFTLVVDRLAMNSIIAHIIPPLFVGVYAIFYRRDLFKIAIISASLLTLLTFVWQLLIIIIAPEVISRFWILENLSGILIIVVPLEELLFAFALGFGASIYYEFITGKAYKKS